MGDDFWKNKRVLASGGAGFLGRAVVSGLSARGAGAVFVPRSRDYDLTHEAGVERLFKEHPADLVIHLAGRSGGIGFNDRNPARFLYENLMMGALMMEHARLSGAGKFVQIGTATAYPKGAAVPFKEDDLWKGPLEETHAPHAMAKLLLLRQAQSYRRQYGFHAITLIAANLYGPGDLFDLEDARVIPAVIRKCLEAANAGQAEVRLWGTGRATRDFLYVEEAAEAVLLAAQHYDRPEPVNLGSGREVAILELAETIARLTGYKGKFAFDASRPEGQPRQFLDTRRARRAFGFEARVPLEEGLRRTIEWYRAARG